MRLITQSALIFCLVLLTGCVSQLSTLKPQAHVSDTKVQSISFDSITLGVLVDVKNPNRFSIPMGLLNLNLMVDGQQIAQAKSEKSTSLKANKSTQVIVPVTIPYSSLFNLVKSARDGNAFQFSVAGNLAVPMPLMGDINIPLSYSGKAPIPQMPKMRISKMAIDSASLTHLKADLVLDVENNNIFPLSLNALKMDIKADGKSLASAAPAEKISLGAEKTNSIHIPLSISNKDAGFALFNSLVSSKKVEWQVDGKGNLGSDLGLNLDDFGFNAKGLLSALRN